MDRPIGDLVHSVRDFVEKHRGFGEGAILALFQAVVSHKIAGKSQSEFVEHLETSLPRVMATNMTVAAIDEYHEHEHHDHLSTIERHAIADPMNLFQFRKELDKDPQAFLETYIGTGAVTHILGRPVAKSMVDLLIWSLDRVERNISAGDDRRGGTRRW